MQETKGERMKTKTWTAWGVVSRSKNRLNGKKEYLVGAYARSTIPELRGCTGSMMFLTRSDCREYIEKTFGYIRQRTDLRDEPFGWRMPKPVKIVVSVKVKQ